MRSTTSQINITDCGPAGDHPGPAVAINTVEGFQLVDVDRRHLHRADPLPVAGPPGLPGQRLHRLDRLGRPVARPRAGTITQDASNPSIYYITGTHTFPENGTYTVANTVAFTGGTLTAPVNGVPISFTFGPVGPRPPALRPPRP